VFVGLLLLTQINCSYFNVSGSVGTALLDGVIALLFDLYPHVIFSRDWYLISLLGIAFSKPVICTAGLHCTFFVNMSVNCLLVRLWLIQDMQW